MPGLDHIEQTLKIFTLVALVPFLLIFKSAVLGDLDVGLVAEAHDVLALMLQLLLWRTDAEVPAAAVGRARPGKIIERVSRHFRSPSQAVANLRLFAPRQSRRL